MAENVVFSNQQNQAPPPQPAVQQGVTPPVQQLPVTPNPFAPPTQGVPPGTPPPALPMTPGVPYQNAGNKRNILKYLIGGGIALLVIIVLFTIIIPMLSSSKKPEQVQLAYWGLWEDEDVMKTVIADFERKYPNITVKYANQSKTNYKDFVQTRIKEGTGPDIFRYHNSWIPTIYSSLLPLSATAISPKEFRQIYYPVIQSDLIRNGGIYGIPLQIDTLALFVNDESFSAGNYSHPKSWYDFANVAAKLTTVDGSDNNRITNSGAAMGTFDNITHAPDIISLLFAQQGVNLKNIFKSPQEMADALTYYVSFAKSDGSSPPIWNKDLNPSIVSFTQGNLAMFFGYSWDIFTIDAAQPTFKYTILPVPYLETPQGPIKTTIASYWVEGVSKKTKHPKEAFLFMNFLTQKETLEKLYKEETKQRPFGELYPRQDMADLLKDTRVKVFVDEAKNAVSTYFSSATYDDGFNGVLNGYLQGAVNDMANNSSGETAVQTLIKQYDQTLNGF